ncbi:MAG: flavin-dependent oxidoreductase [Burkholderiaceae bacterium]
MQVLIIGAGIGGLSLALSLHAANIRCRVYEAAPTIEPLGVGINLLPHSVKELEDLGLLPALLAEGIRTAELMYVSKRGEIVWREPRGLAAGYRWPQISIHRGHLQRLLLEAVIERIGADNVVTNRRAVRAHTVRDERSGEPRARVDFVRTDDDGPAPSIDADLAVAADGIHSALRAQHYPAEGLPVWSGMILWRGTTIAPPTRDGATMTVMGTAEQKFVTYPIHQYADGRQLINWIAEILFDENTLKTPQDWNRQGSRKDFLPRFEGWRTGDLDIAELIRNSREIYEYPMSDRNAVDAWTFGRMVLLGDAAHAMYPIGSNGGSQAILDARRLAYELSTRESIDEALAAYEAIRRPAMTALLAANRAEGPDAVLHVLEQRAPDGYDDLEAVLPLAERQSIAAQYKLTAGFDVDTLNGSEPLRPRVRTD